MYSAIRELREQRIRLIEQANAILAKANADKRSTLTPEEIAEFDRLEAEAKALKERIDREERGLELRTELASSAGLLAAGRETRAIDPNLPRDAKELGELQCRAFSRWAAQGEGGLNQDEVRALQPLRVTAGPQQQEELRAQGVGTGAGGGFTVPQGFFPQLEQALKQFGSVLAAGPTIVPTDSGNDIPYATVNDTGNVGELLAEAAASNAQDATFAQVVLKAFYYGSKTVLVSWELMADSAFDFGGIVAPILGERIGRITNQHFTTGTGAGQPQGIVTAAVLGHTAAGQAVVTYDEWLELEHSVDPAYRAGAKVMTSDMGLKMLRKVKDGDQRPIFQASTLVGAPDSIGPYSLVINQDMAVPAASAKSILFGAMNKYKVRQVRAIEVFRIADKFIETRQTGFVAFARMDGRMVNAGTNPIKYLAQAA